MLKQVIEATRLSPEFCASLLRVPAEQFRQWIDGKQPIPQFVIPEMTAILGVSEKSLLTKGTIHADGGSLAPAIWFKLRSDELSDADRELVGLVRRLGFFMAQLEAIRGSRSSRAWRAVAQAVLEPVDRSAPPAVQGRDAAVSFRAAANLDHGQAGVGDFIRPRLRQVGVVVIESPIPKSSLEGCCFSIGREGDLRPCVFANTFKSTWFRRNETLLHEVCHAIFDLENDPVSLDFRRCVPALSPRNALCLGRSSCITQTNWESTGNASLRRTSRSSLRRSMSNSRPSFARPMTEASFLKTSFSNIRPTIAAEC
jgi:hypothetical protein